MKYRYIIERAPDTAHRNFLLSEITKDDETGHVLGAHDYLDDLKAEAQKVEAERSHDSVTWKDAPKSWQPDTILVSQWLDDGVEENRDS